MKKKKIGFNLITKWLENYEGANMEITNKILSYKINSISLNSKKRRQIYNIINI